MEIDYYRNNKAYYDEFYRRVNPRQIVERVRQRETFLSDSALPPDWEGLYWGGFRRGIAGATILELGAGDGLNSLIMAALGAKKVVAVDITYHTVRIVADAAMPLRLSGRVEARMGDFARMDFPSMSFDYVVGKSILRHLTHDMEDRYIQKAADLLKPTGEVRFSESVPVVHEVPEKGLYPPREDSPAHYQELFSRYFADVQLVPVRRMQRVHVQVIIAREPIGIG